MYVCVCVCLYVLVLVVDVFCEIFKILFFFVFCFCFVCHSSCPPTLYLMRGGFCQFRLLCLILIIVSYFDSCYC